MNGTDSTASSTDPMTMVEDAESTEETISFTEWRAGRPLPGAIALVIGGLIIAWPAVTFLLETTLIQSESLFGFGVVVGALIVFLGIGVLLRPEYSTGIGLASLVLASASIIISFGGLLVGMLVASIGGILCFAWTPAEDSSAEK